MSLETFHKLFVACAALFSLLLCGWGVREWAATGSVSALSIAVAGAVAVALLALYAQRSWLQTQPPEEGR